MRLICVNRCDTLVNILLKIERKIEKYVSFEELDKHKRIFDKRKE